MSLDFLLNKYVIGIGRQIPKPKIFIFIGHSVAEISYVKV